MKKTFAMLLAAVMLFAAGCGAQPAGTAAGEDTQKTTGAQQEASGATEGNGAPIALLMAQRDEWLSVLQTSIQDEAQKAGYALQSYDASGDGNAQIACIEAAKTNGAKALIVNLTKSALAPSILEAAGDMSVVFVNREPEDAALMGEHTVYVGADETIPGRLQGEALADYFDAQGKNEIRYILLSGTEGLEHTRLRTEGVLNTLKERGITTVAVGEPLVCNYDRLTALNSITPVLQQNEFDCVISNNDAMALGAIEAMKQAGIDPKTKPVVGIDLLDDAKDAVRSGELLMTAYQNADAEAKCAVGAAINLLENKPFDEGLEYTASESSPYAIHIAFDRVDAGNLAEYE